MGFVSNISKNPLFKATSLNGLSVGIKILTGLISSKLIALFIGPAGLALVGNLRNFITFIDTFSTFGFQNGIVKYVAENEKDEERLPRILTTVFITLFSIILLISLLMALFSGCLNDALFGPEFDYAWIFRIFAFVLPWYAGNIIFISVINGLGKFKEVITINIAGNILGIILSIFIIWQMHTPGALLALILSPASVFLFSFYQLNRHFPGFRFLKWNYYEFPLLKGFFSYTLMSLLTAVLAPAVYFSVRKTIVLHYGLEAGGQWEAMNRIAAFYLLFVSTLLTVYFLPKLTVAANNRETRKVFLSYYKGIVPVFLLGIIVIYFLREFIIRLLLSPDFLPMKDLFFWQLLGDLLKVSSIILGYEFFAKKLTKAYIVTEIMSYSVLFISSQYLIGRYGAEGAVMAHAFTYFVYLVVLMVYFRKKLF